ncbi:hypothetical protein [Kribbella sp. DT2]|uniref:hypothetical protein n=1 Tax=Kribbella sp. DT2 TaxID=3393427 RepID=UPI003CEE74F0
MRKSAVFVSVLAASALAAVPVAAHAAPAAAGTTQPYTHLVTGKTWTTGGTYVAKGGEIKLTLKTLPKATDVFVEECESADLGDVKTFTPQANSQVLATGVAKGTCFVVLLKPHAGTGDYQVRGTLGY